MKHKDITMRVACLTLLLLLCVVGFSACTLPASKAPDTIDDPKVEIPGDIAVPQGFEIDDVYPSRSEITGNLRFADVRVSMKGEYGAVKAKAFFVDRLQKQGWQWQERFSSSTEDRWSSVFTKGGDKLQLEYFEEVRQTAGQGRYSLIDIRLNGTRR